MDALIGEFAQDDAEDQMVIRRQDGSLLLDGLIPIIDLKDVLEIRTLQDEEEGRYQTLNGLLMYELGKIPQTADVVEAVGWRLEIVDLDGKRVDKVLAQKIPYEESEDELQD